MIFWDVQRFKIVKLRIAKFQNMGDPTVVNSHSHIMNGSLNYFERVSLGEALDNFNLMMKRTIK